MKNTSLLSLYYHPTESGKRKRQLLNLPRDTQQSDTAAYQANFGNVIAYGNKSTMSNYSLAGYATDNQSRKWFDDKRGAVQIHGYINAPYVSVSQLVSTPANMGVNLFAGSGAQVRNLVSKAGQVLAFPKVTELQGEWGDANVGLYPFNMKLNPKDPLSVNFARALFDPEQSQFAKLNAMNKARQQALDDSKDNNKIRMKAENEGFAKFNQDQWDATAEVVDDGYSMGRPVRANRFPDANYRPRRDEDEDEGDDEAKGGKGAQMNAIIARARNSQGNIPGFTPNMNQGSQQTSYAYERGGIPNAKLLGAKLSMGPVQNVNDPNNNQLYTENNPVKEQHQSSGIDLPHYSSQLNLHKIHKIMDTYNDRHELFKAREEDARRKADELKQQAVALAASSESEHLRYIEQKRIDHEWSTGKKSITHERVDAVKYLTPLHNEVTQAAQDVGIDVANATTANNFVFRDNLSLPSLPDNENSGGRARSHSESPLFTPSLDSLIFGGTPEEVDRQQERLRGVIQNMKATFEAVGNAPQVGKSSNSSSSSFFDNNLGTPFTLPTSSNSNMQATSHSRYNTPFEGPPPVGFTPDQSAPMDEDEDADAELLRIEQEDFNNRRIKESTERYDDPEKAWRIRYSAQGRKPDFRNDYEHRKYAEVRGLDQFTVKSWPAPKSAYLTAREKEMVMKHENLNDHIERVRIGDTNIRKKSRSSSRKITLPTVNSSSQETENWNFISTEHINNGHGTTFTMNSTENSGAGFFTGSSFHR